MRNIRAIRDNAPTSARLNGTRAPAMKSAIETDSLRRWCRALLLPLLLLVAQQGAFLHELRHCASAHIHDDEHEHEAGAPCTLCLAFADVECAADFSTGTVPLLPGLRFALLAVMPIVVLGTSAPAQRNRGPPSAG